MYQLESEGDICGRYQALSTLASQASLPATPEAEKLEIVQTYRKVLEGNAYWRLKSAVLFRLRQLMPVSPTGALVPDPATSQVVLKMAKKEKSWLRAAAINFLAATKDSGYVSLYLDALSDPSDRVINAAAVGLGATKGAAAFPALCRLVNKSSMKSQSLLSALGGLRELGDSRAAEIITTALADVNRTRWRLPVGSVWDFRVVAARTLVSLGCQEKGHSIVKQQFETAFNEEDMGGMFNSALLISILSQPAGKEIFARLKQKYQADENAIKAVLQLESEFLENVKSKK